ncbi:MAG: hypothetical protein ABH875_04810 [Candidatus Omnitrophota bacterium]
MKNRGVAFFVSIALLVGAATCAVAQYAPKIVGGIVSAYRCKIEEGLATMVGAKMAAPAEIEKAHEKDALPCSKGLNGEAACIPKAGGAIKPGRGFNDNDYFVGRDRLPAAEVAAEGSPHDRVDHALNDDRGFAKAERQQPVGPNNVSGSIAQRVPNIGSAPSGMAEGELLAKLMDEIPLADEGIAMPQLPLIDMDFEAESDAGGMNDMLLPELPELD